MRAQLILSGILLVGPATPGLLPITRQHLSMIGGQRSVKELETKLESQYRETQKLFASPPRAAGLLPADYHRLLREWQDDLAQSFVRAAATVAEILALNPPERDMWQERLETLHLYSQPISALNSEASLDRAKCKHRRAFWGFPLLNILMKHARQRHTETFGCAWCWLLMEP